MDAVWILAISDFVVLARSTAVAGRLCLEAEPREPNGANLTQDGLHLSDASKTYLNATTTYVWRRKKERERERNSVNMNLLST